MSQPQNVPTPYDGSTLAPNFDPDVIQVMDELVPEFAAAQVALREFAAFACATIEHVGDNPELEMWIRNGTRDWVGEHARQALYVLGMVCTAYGVSAQEVADIVRALSGVE